MNALEVSAVELVSIAHEVGCQYVCVFTHVPEPDMPFGGITPEMVPEMQARMAATGVPVMNIEIFPLTEDVDVDSFRPGIELGAQLGGKRVITVIYDTVETRAAENLARLCDLASEYDMKVGLEFMTLTPGCTTIESAAEFIRLAGKANTGIAVDPLHLIRSGGTTDDVVALPTELFGYAQICDGADLEPSSEYMTEVFERMLPGEGVFPLTAFLDAVPAATPVEVEVPSLIGEQDGVPPLERARRAAKAAREVLDRAQPTR